MLKLFFVKPDDIPLSQAVLETIEDKFRLSSTIVPVEIDREKCLVFTGIFISDGAGQRQKDRHWAATYTSFNNRIAITLYYAPSIVQFTPQFSDDEASRMESEKQEIRVS